MMKNIFYILSVFCLISCGNKIKPSEVKSFIENPVNGYKQQSDNGIIKAECIYQPVESMVANALRKDKISGKEYRDLKKEYGESSYFTLKLYYPGEPDAEMKQYVNFYLQNDLKLVIGKDTIACNSFLAEPYNGVTPFQNILAGYPVKNISGKNFEIIIDAPYEAYYGLSFKYNDHEKIKDLSLKLN